MKITNILISCTLCAAMLLSLAGCGDASGNSSDQDTTTQSTTTKKTTTTTSSIKANVESDYDIKEIEDLVVEVGTSEEDGIAQLPKEVEVLVTGASDMESEMLFSDSFDDYGSFLQNWTTTGNDAGDVMAVENGAMVVKKASNCFRSYINDKDWMNMESKAVTNYAIKTVIKGTSESPTNNYGVIFRATDVLETGPDGYKGMYVGLGGKAGSLCIGYADHKWHLIQLIDIDYEANHDYTLEIFVYNESFAVVLDGVKMYEGICMFDYGSVGLRTFEQLFEVQDFEVRTLGKDDFKYFDLGYQVYEKHPVTWSCTDYDPNAKGKYGFIGKVTDLEKAAILVKVQVKESDE